MLEIYHAEAKSRVFMFCGMYLSLAVLYAASVNDHENHYLLHEVDGTSHTTTTLTMGVDEQANTWILQIKAIRDPRLYEVYPVNVQADKPVVLLRQGRFVKNEMRKMELAKGDLEFIETTIREKRYKLGDFQRLEKYKLGGSRVYYLYASSESNMELGVDHPALTIVRGKKNLVLDYVKLTQAVDIDGKRYYIFERLDWDDKEFVDIYDADWNRIDSVQFRDSG